MQTSRRDACASLEAGDSAFQAVADSVPHLVWLAHADGTAEYWNAAAAAYLGLPWAPGKHCEAYAYIHSEDRQAAGWHSRSNLTLLHGFTARLRGHDGGYRWFLLRVRDMLLACGERRLLLTATDVDERERVFSALTEGPHFVFVHDELSAKAEYVSPSFLKFAGLDVHALVAADVLQRLVHPGDLEAVDAAKFRAKNGDQAEFEFRLRGPNGSYRWMRGIVRAVNEGAAPIHRFVVTAQDIDARKRIEQRLSLLVRAGEIFHRSLDIRETLGNVARLAVGDFCDLCIFDLLEGPEERLYSTAAAHRDPACERELLDVGALVYDRELRVHHTVRVTETGRSYFVRRMDDKVIIAHAASKRHAEFMQRLHYRALIVVPAVANGEIFGALTFVLTGEDRDFDDSDLEFAEELGRRAGSACLNARLYTRERHIAATLQHAFLPVGFPLRPGVRFDALYRPASDDVELGGDWYDVFETRRGEVVIAIGDVAGTGVHAARTMVQLREAIRVASVRTVDPAEILCLANDSLFVESGDRFASAWVAVIPVNAARLTYAGAGHPPPFVRRADASVEQLLPSGQMLGVTSECEVDNRELGIEPGMLLVLYTDGLTEISRDVIGAEREIVNALRSDAVARAASPARALERAVVHVPQQDDLAILTIRFD